MTVFCQNGLVRKKTTVYIDQGLLKAAKIMAVRSGKRQYKVFEEALRHHLGLGVVNAIRERSNLSEDDAMNLADEEKHASRE